MEFLTRLADSDFSQAIVANAYVYQYLLVAHALGMALVVGVVLVLDLRVLGFPKGLPVAAFDRLLTVAQAGFVLNALSGAILFATNAPKLAMLWTFQIKILAIVLGGVSVWLLWQMVDGVRDPDFRFPPRARLLAAASAMFWLTAIVAGRFIAYTMPPDL